MVSNKYLCEIYGIFENGFMTYPQFEISLIGDKNYGTIGAFDWDKNVFILNTDYEFYKEAKYKLSRAKIRHEESKIEEITETYKTIYQ